MHVEIYVCIYFHFICLYVIMSGLKVNLVFEWYDSQECLTLDKFSISKRYHQYRSSTGIETG